MRRATPSSTVIVILRKNFYPRSPCGERPDTRSTVCSVISISIHALLAESDPSTHQKNPSKLAFLSTLSLRRATHIVGGAGNNAIHFYPRSPCGERRGNKRRKSSNDSDFYPRSPCGERRQRIGIRVDKTQFLSTLSLRRATPEKSESLTTYLISIHALLAESDRRGAVPVILII